MQTLEEILAEEEPRVRETNIDPHSIDLYYSYNRVDPIWEETENRDSEIGVIRSTLPQLPKHFQKLYELAYIKGLTQKQMVSILGTEQSSLSRSLTSLTSLLKATLAIPKLEQRVVLRNLNKLKPAKKRCARSFMKTYRITTTAEDLGVSVAFVSQSIKDIIALDTLSEPFKAHLQAIVNLHKRN